MHPACLIARHKVAGPVIFNEGLYFSTCKHCGTDIIRESESTWRKVPRGYRVVWRPVGRHVVLPWRPARSNYDPGLLKSAALSILPEEQISLAA